MITKECNLQWSRLLSALEPLFRGSSSNQPSVQTVQPEPLLRPLEIKPQPSKKPRVAIATLVLSAAGFVGITNHEAFRAKAYNDGVNVQTIGFGTTEGVKIGDTITVEKALVRALQDSEKFQGAVKECVKVPLHQYEYDAYISLSYNIGTGAFCNSTLVKKLNAEDYAGACAQISVWDKAGGKVLKGLTIRRAAERKLCEGE